VLYVLSDVCTDATWVHHDYPAVRKDDADLTAAELALSQAMRGGPESNQNRYNLVHALNLEYFEEFYPERLEQLAEAMRREEGTLNPFYNMTLTKNLSLEEQIRHFYKAREWAVRYGLELKYANHQETPSIAWDLAGILADCGIDFLVKGILPYECPWAARLAEPPVFLWEGPDGARVKLRRRNQDYAEAYCLLKGLEETNRQVHEKTIPEFEAWGKRYPFSAIGMVGVYGDLVMAEPGKLQARDFPVLKAAAIARYNAQGWEYPRLVNAAHAQFWQEIDRQISERGIELEVSRGDYGAGWDMWPACLASDAQGWRRAQERSALADRLAAILARIDAPWYEAQAGELSAAWKNLKMLADHAWNGANHANRLLNRRLRREWQTAANQGFDRVIRAGLSALAAHVAPQDQASLLAFNPLGWERDGLAAAPGADARTQVIDSQSGESLPVQFDPQAGSLYFLARGVPSLGYRTFRLAASASPSLAEAASPRGPFVFGQNTLEGSFYRVEISPVTGGICSLYDKTRRKELVQPDSPYHLNQALYFSEGAPDPGGSYPLFQALKIEGGAEYTPASAQAAPGAQGPLFASLVVTAAMQGIRLKTTITLHAHFDRVDIRNEILKPVSEERQQLDFAFPFLLPDRQIRLEQPGAILDPERESLPGAGLSAAVVRHFVDLFNAENGVTLSLIDSFTIQFGGRTTALDPQTIPPSSTIFALALGNIYDSNEAIRDQGGVEEFVFRFSLRGHAAGFEPVSALRSAWESCNPLETVPLTGPGTGELPPEAHSFAWVEPSSVILAGFKAAEEEGLIARLWEIGGEAAEAEVRLAIPGAPVQGILTDHLERDRAELRREPGGVVVPVKGRGVATARFLW
jgi:alpha-mannosidase